MSIELVPKDVPGFEDYYYLDPVRKTVVSKRSGRPLKPKYDSTGYPEVHLYGDGKESYKRIHRLFGESYLPNPDNLPCINHKDEDKTNFSLDNLEWCTKKYNTNYGTANERRSSKTIGQPRQYVSDRQSKPTLAIDHDGNEVLFPSGKAAANALGIPYQKVTDVIGGRRKSYRGYVFRNDLNNVREE